jgi:hypothetical protein
MAFADRTDSIIFELDLELHAKEEAERVKQLEVLSAATKIEQPASSLKTSTPAFTIKQMTGDKEYQFVPPPSHLFDPVVRVLLAAAEIPYWVKGRVSGELGTVNPDSRWQLESEDVTRRIHLKRIRAT